VTTVFALVVAIGVAQQRTGAPAQLSAYTAEQQALMKYTPNEGELGENLAGAESYWNTRITYPTGHFNAGWVRRAAAQDDQVERADEAAADNTPDPGAASGGSGGSSSPGGSAAPLTSSSSEPVAAATAPFVSLGPKPLRMTGCSGCYNYTSTEGRMNDIAMDPTTTGNGAITAYAASVGGGVWKTTNCCTASTAWVVTTDDPLLSTTSIDSITIDPTNHNVIYAGTGDLNFGSFSMGSQGILKSTDGGSTWTVVGRTIFGATYPEPSGQFPQYQAVGKVRVDPRNGNNVVAGTKTGLYFSYDAGANWTGPCLTNSFATQRQDITALELTNVGGATRIIAGVGARGYATPVQYDLGQNGANGLYSATLGTSGCPTFASITSNANGFKFQATAVAGSAYAANANLNATSGAPYVSASSGNQVGRIDIGIAPSNPDVVYAQVQSIAANSNSGCGNVPGCQLGVFLTTNGGSTWSMLTGSAGGALRNCTGGQGDYAQNWYDQAVAVDPANPDRVLISTFDIWFATRTGTAFNDLSCGYSYSGSAGPVHTDQHAIAFAPGSSSVALFGNDGGLRASTNVNAATATVDPTFFDVNEGTNTIEFYSGDISANFATAAAPYANGGAQDNGSMSVTFSGQPTGPVQWQMGKGGDGFFARIDPVSGRLFQGNNSGHINRCTTNCTGSGASWTDISNSTMLGDTQSFVLPYEIFKGTPGNPGGQTSTDCAATTCNHILSGTVRVWENINASGVGGTSAWYVNSPANLTKQTLGNRSYINQLAYSPATWSLGVVGTNDGNVQVGRNLGTGSNQSTWVNVTGSNSVLPNRPILDVAMDPRALNTATAPVIAYAAVGGFNANSPSTPGHVYRVTCEVNCASFVWEDKTGNLPDMPADSIIVNPKYPNQVYVGTDIGLYVTDDITQATPTWYRLQSGLPNVMVWDLQIDRGNSTLSVWTRSRGAYVWTLPSKRLVKLNQTIALAPIESHVFGDADFAVSALASSGLPVALSASGACSIVEGKVHVLTAGSCTITTSQAGSDDYNAAPNVSQTFAIAKASQTINFGTTEPKVFGDADFDVTADASSGLPVSLAVASGKCTLNSTTSPAAVHLVGAGLCVLRATQSGNDNYEAAEDVTREFSVARANQTITFGGLGGKTWGDGDFTVSASASSGLDVTFSAAENCTVSSTGTVHITGAGSCTITASQLGDDDWNPAADVSNELTIARADQSVTFDGLGDKTYGDSDFSLNASASSHLTVSYAAAGTCTVSGSTLHITGAGSCEVTASQPGDANFNAAAAVTQRFAIAQAGQSISFDAISNATYGDPDIAIAPTASSGLPVYLIAASGPCALDTATSPAHIHLVGAGTCTITATQSGDANYKPASDESRSFSIGKADQTIAFGALPNKGWAAEDFNVEATATSGLQVQFAGAGSCSVSDTTVHLTGVGTCTVTASQPGNADWNAAPSVARSFEVTWPFRGFLQPIDNGIVNIAKAGSAIPVKFDLGGNRGLSILAAGSPTSSAIDCTNGAEDAIEATVTAGSSSLQYDATAGHYIYVWKTSSAWASSCRVLSVKLIDNTVHKATFRFAK
jgi:hypothetical protein